MSELSMPTRGPVIVDERDIHDERRYILTEIGGQPYVVAQVGLARSPDIRAMQEADADLIAAAFNSAEAARQLGYDPIAAIQAVPKMMKALQTIAARGDFWKGWEHRAAAIDALPSTRQTTP